MTPRDMTSKSRVSASELAGEIANLERLRLNPTGLSTREAYVLMALYELSNRRAFETTDRTTKLEFALRGLYWDQVDYLTLNKLGGMQNHWMRAAREALGDDIRPAVEPTREATENPHTSNPESQKQP